MKLTIGYNIKNWINNNIHGDKECLASGCPYCDEEECDE